MSSSLTDASDKHCKANQSEKTGNWGSIHSPFSQGNSRRTQEVGIQASESCPKWKLPPLLIPSSSQLSHIIVPQPIYKYLSPIRCPTSFLQKIPTSTIGALPDLIPNCFLQILMASTLAGSACRFYAS